MNLLTIKNAVVLDCGILILLIIGRTIYSLTTGYMLPDEGWYTVTFVLQPIGFSVYRPIMNLAYVIFFSGADSILEFFVRGAIYSTVWAISSIIVLAKVLRALDIQERPAALTILTFMILPVFPLMAVFFVTETMAIFFGLAGILFAIRYLKEGKIKNAFIAGTMFLFASEVREPYILFVLVIPIVLFFMRWNTKAFLAYGSVAIIAAPIPISIIPFNISQPISTFIFQYLPNYILASFYHGVGSAAAASTQFPSYVYVSGATTLNVNIGGPGLYAFLVGAAYGIGPIFGALIIISLFYSLKTKSKAGYLVFLFSVLGIISYLATADLTVGFQSDAASVWTSDLIRLSSAAIPAAVGLAYLYSKLKTRTVFIALTLTVILGVAVAGNFSSAVQSTQNIQGSNIDRLSLSYRSPYLMMYQDAQPNSLVIVGGSGIAQVSVFMAFAKNITVEPIPGASADFHQLISEGWSHVYLYDDWTTLNASFIARCNCYPAYYTSFILSYNNGASPLILLWSNSESYALELNQ